MHVSKLDVAHEYSSTVWAFNLPWLPNTCLTNGKKLPTANFQEIAEKCTGPTAYEGIHKYASCFNCNTYFSLFHSKLFWYRYHHMTGHINYSVVGAARPNLSTFSCTTYARANRIVCRPLPHKEIPCCNHVRLSSWMATSLVYIPQQQRNITTEWLVC